MKNRNWDTYFFKLISVSAEKSKDRSSGVGAIIVGPEGDNDIRTMGYNGFPPGVNDDIDARHERPAKYLWTEHAERNAIYGAAKVGIPLGGCRIFIDWYPCSRCARAIIRVGISEVVIDSRGCEEKKAYWQERWKDDMDVAQVMLKEAGVKVRMAFGEDVHE